MIKELDEKGSVALSIPNAGGLNPKISDIWSKGNPYNKKKPVIMGAKRKKIAYGDRHYKVMAGIRAKNTTGYDVTKRVKTVVDYRPNASYVYEEVKKVNTKKPGDYRITYQLTDEIGRKIKYKINRRPSQMKKLSKRHFW